MFNAYHIAGTNSVNQGASYSLALSSDSTSISSWTINWGDGTTSSPDVQTTTGNPSAVTHTYTNGGTTSPITATATDSSGIHEATPTISGTYPVLTAGATGVQSILAGEDDATDTIKLGTNTFQLYGTTYTGSTALNVSSNGMITFPTGDDDYSNADFNDNPDQAAIAPLWKDLVLDNENSSVLFRFDDTNSDGTPDRLIVQWTDAHPYDDSGSATFQAILQLNTGSQDGQVVFNYVSIPQDYFNSATVGVKSPGSSGNPQNVLSYNAVPSWATTDPLTSVAIDAHSPLAVTVTNSDAAISGPSTAAEGTAYTLSLSTSHSSVTSWSINWGDGTLPSPDVQTVTGNPSSVTHSYTAAGTYTISASATDSGGTYVANSLTVTALVPLAPTTLSATLAGSHVALSWQDNSSFETGYVIQRSTDNSTWTTLATTAANATSYTDSNVSPGLTYYYQIKAINAAGSSSNASTSYFLAPAVGSVTWVGAATGGDWNTASNWSSGTVPNQYSDVVLSSTSAMTLNMGTESLHSLIVSTPATLSGGSLTVANTVAANSTLQLSSIAVIGADFISWTSGTPWLQISNASFQSVTLDTDATISNGSLDVYGGLTNNGNLTATSSASLFFDGTQTLGGTGTVFFSNYIDVRNNSNGSSAVFTIDVDQTINGYGTFNTDGGSIVNDGTVATVTPNTTLSIGATLINNGVFDILTGTTVDLNQGHTVTNNGEFDIFGGTLTLQGTWSSTNGVIGLSSGTANLGGTFTTADLANFFNVSGTANISGALNNSGNTLTLDDITGILNLVSGGKITGGAIDGASGTA